MTHYFDEDPTVASDRREVEWSLPDGSLRLVTDAGVFGHGRVDTGTKLLLLKAPAAAARRTSARPRLRDRRDRADDGAASAGRHRVGGRRQLACPRALRARTRARNGIDERPRRRARRGAGRHLLRSDLEQPADPDRQAGTPRPPAPMARPARVPTPSAHLVVQKHLGADSLQQWLIAQGFPTDRVAIGAGFRVLRVRPAT